MGASEKFRPQPANAIAVRVTGSWLRACAIEHDDSQTPGCDLVVLGRNGELQEVSVVVSDQIAPATAIAVSAAAIGSTNLELALGAFWALTEAVGYGSPMPVDRGPRSATRPYAKDVFLVVGRHMEFRGAPDLPAAELAKYDHIVCRESRNFALKNTFWLERMGYEADDVKSYMWVWLHNFLHRFALRNLAPGADDNQRLFTKYSRDRLTELWRSLMRDSLTQLPSVAKLSWLTPDVSYELDAVMRPGETCGRGHREIVATINPSVTDDIAAMCADALKEDDERADARKRKATLRVLQANLAGTPLPELVVRLEAIANSAAHDYGTRRVAAKMLREKRAELEANQSASV